MLHDDGPLPLRNETMGDSTTSTFSEGPGNWSDLNISWNRVALLRDMGQAERALAEAG